jgi:hypothetical protein
METAIELDVDKTIKDFVALLSTIKPGDYNKIPFEGSWTPGQVVQHVLLSITAFTDLIYGPTKETDRDPGAGISKLREIFLDFSTKLNSPDFILPPSMDYTSAEQIKILEEKRGRLVAAGQTMDLSKTCTLFPMPASGFITRLEALHFVVVHTKRHTHQLEKICRTINK